MLAVFLWIIAGFTAFSTISNLALKAKEHKPYIIAFALIWGAFVVVVSTLAAIAIS